MSDVGKGTIKERLARLEVLMCNHLKHHERYFKILLVMLPVIITGIGAILIKVYWG